jgi:hypothetical protein
MKLHVGASRIRAIAKEAATRDAVAFLRLIWPHLTPRQAELIATYPEETSVNGSYLKLPASWDVL